VRCFAHEWVEIKKPPGRVAQILNWVVVFLMPDLRSSAADLRLKGFWIFNSGNFGNSGDFGNLQAHLGPNAEFAKAQSYQTRP
jgi:hypothetical protein